MSPLPFPPKIYPASAGTGKTYTLAAEYIALMLADTSAKAFGRILAVTFTNKATAEMKERILRFLYDLANGGGNDVLQKVRTLMPQPAPSEAEVRSRAAKALSAIVHDYDFFRVETIDSFFWWLLSGVTHELGMPSGVRADINDTEAVRQAVDCLIKKSETDKELRGQMERYVHERIEDDKNWNFKNDLLKLAGQLTSSGFLNKEEELVKSLNNISFDEYRKEIGNLKAGIEQQLTALAETLNRALTNLNGEWDERLAYPGDLRSYIGKIAVFEDFTPANRLLKRIEAPENWLKAADTKDASAMAAAGHWREVLADTEEKRVQLMPVLNTCAICLDRLNPLSLLQQTRKALQQVNEENSREMIAYVPYIFRNSVAAADAPFVLERAGSRFDHIMIDEFQDTSSMQWENFRKLLLESMSTGGKCLLVGDVKQAIYRFRGGDWEILEGLNKEYKGKQNGGEDILCKMQTNFRTDERIVRFNNQFFPKAAAIIDSLGGGEAHAADIYEEAGCQEAKHKGDVGYVRIAVSSKPGAPAASDEEGGGVLDEMAEQMQRLHAEGLPYREMCILVRKKGEAADIVDAFAEKEIPLISDEAFLLSASPAVLTVIDALRVLADDGNKLALASLAKTYRPDAPLHDSEAMLNALPQEFTGRRAELAAMPLYELCEELIRIFGLWQNAAVENTDEAHAAGQLAYLTYFLDLVAAYLQDNASSLPDFLDHWDEILFSKSIPGAVADGVRVLTIHKSKGLEAHTVFIPFCDWNLEKDHNDTILWLTPRVAPFSKISPIPVAPHSKRVKHSIFAADYEQEHLRSRIENLNLLYVAFTRPRHNLFVWGTWSGKDKDKDQVATVGDLLHKVIDNNFSDDYQKYRYEETAEGFVLETLSSPRADCRAEGQAAPAGGKQNPFGSDVRRPMHIALCQTPLRANFCQSGEAAEFIAARAGEEEAADAAAYINRGNLMHKIFSMIETAADISRAVGVLRGRGFEADGIDFDKIETEIRQKIAACPLVADLTDGSWLVLNERSILLPAGNGQGVAMVRPDRVSFKDGRAVVLDYKFGKPLPKHQEQVKQYAAYLRQMGTPHVKAFLWYFDENKLVEAL
ncbi:MAG: UvrD-helicase domain-containing protein [Alloprevotella sp.]